MIIWLLLLIFYFAIKQFVMSMYFIKLVPDFKHTLYFILELGKKKKKKKKKKRKKRKEKNLGIWFKMLFQETTALFPEKFYSSKCFKS